MRFARHWALSGAPRIGNLRNRLFVPGTPTVFQNRLLFVPNRPIEAQFCVFDPVTILVRAADFESDWQHRAARREPLDTWVAA